MVVGLSARGVVADFICVKDYMLSLTDKRISSLSRVEQHFSCASNSLERFMLPSS